MQVLKTVTNYGNTVFRTLNGHLVARSCSKCKLVLPGSRFTFNKNRKTYRAMCSDCVMEDMREKGYMRRTPYEKRIKTNKAWAAKNKNRTEKEIHEIQKIKYPDGKKTCPKCKEAKLLSHYHRSKIIKDGLSVYCKTCARTYKRK